jgi:hypothetical protein
MQRRRSERARSHRSTGRDLASLGRHASEYELEPAFLAFDMAANRLRFEINADAADAAGLEISSQLLKLATRIIRSGS